MTPEELKKLQEQKDAETKLEQEKEEFVSKKAYEEVSKDMHSYKSKLKELEAIANQLKAEKEAQEHENLAEQNRWQELAEINAQKAKEAADALKNTNAKYENDQKKNLVTAELGGFKLPEYASFINVDNVDLENIETVKAEADRIRQIHGSLLKSSNSRDLPNDAPAGHSPKELSYENLTPEQRDKIIRDQLLGK